MFRMTKGLNDQIFFIWIGGQMNRIKEAHKNLQFKGFLTIYVVWRRGRSKRTLDIMNIF
jgi:hypothetical protein